MRSVLPTAYCQQPCYRSKPTHSAPQYFAILRLFFVWMLSSSIPRASLLSEKEWLFQPDTWGNWDTERIKPWPAVWLVCSAMAAIDLSPSTEFWLKICWEKIFKLWFHWMLWNRITAVLEPASYRAHVSLSVETKNQFYISNWLIRSS